MKPAVGDSLWFVPGYRGQQARYVTVTRVGRKYFYADNYTFEIGTGRGKDTQGCVYPSQQTYEDQNRINAKWLALRRGFNKQHWLPDGVDESTIDRVAALFGINLENAS